ncbi:hypothetical protein ACFUTX_00165 [Microbacterium sp. NPDC057407]|uniref:hypothetical protein n=1 Tax=Microbacterium sp. NPDC057407 TaxID=3346120 RepID=UPI00366A8B41
MSTELSPAPVRGIEHGSPPPRRGRRAGLAALVVAIIVLIGVGLVIFGWMVNETHFNRPSPELEEFATEIDRLPGVASVDTERWVEAPTFSNPTTTVAVAVDRAGLPALLDAACATDYPDGVTWAIRVVTPSSTEVSLHASSPPDSEAASRCLDFGFDAAGLIDELGRVGPGLSLQPSIFEPGRLTVVEVEEARAGFTHLLPLVAYAPNLLAAAGLAFEDDVEINAATLGVRLSGGEAAEYLALLRELADDRGVTSFWASDATQQTDGVAKVQLVAPALQQTAIERAITSSALPIAAYSIRFIEQ